MLILMVALGAIYRVIYTMNILTNYLKILLKTWEPTSVNLPAHEHQEYM